MQLYVDPPPTNVLAEAELIEIVLVPGVMVKFVVLVTFHAVAPEPVMVHVPVPMTNSRVEVAVVLKLSAVMFADVVVNVPLDKIIPPTTRFRFLDSSTRAMSWPRRPGYFIPVVA